MRIISLILGSVLASTAVAYNPSSASREERQTDLCNSSAELLGAKNGCHPVAEQGLESDEFSTNVNHLEARDEPTSTASITSIRSTVTRTSQTTAYITLTRTRTSSATKSTVSALPTTSPITSSVSSSNVSSVTSSVSSSAFPTEAVSTSSFCQVSTKTSISISISTVTITAPCTTMYHPTYFPSTSDNVSYSTTRIAFPSSKTSDVSTTTRASLGLPSTARPSTGFSGTGFPGGPRPTTPIFTGDAAIQHTSNVLFTAAGVAMAVCMSLML